MITDPQRLDYLDSMGIQSWVRRTRDESSNPVEVPVSQDMDWAGLEARVSKCTACTLHQGRSRTVFGVGNTNPDWLIIGEAPGADEDQQGEPFVGRAGQLLNGMLKAAGFDREAVYITNIVKCRPPNNRNPRVDEAEACQSYLTQQIQWLAPKLILAVGRVAANNLLDSDLALGRMRGTVHRYGQDNVPVVVTYHPAYLLRKPSEKVKVWQDLCMALSVTEGLSL